MIHQMQHMNISRNIMMKIYLHDTKILMSMKFINYALVEVDIKILKKSLKIHEI